MATQPLMPKATAVWLVEHTSLSFDQIADFCKLHPLEIKAIADDEGAQSIIGRDPIVAGQLTREEIARGEGDPNYRLKLAEAKVHLPETKRKRGRAIRRCRAARIAPMRSCGWCAIIRS